MSAVLSVLSVYLFVASAFLIKDALDRWLDPRPRRYLILGRSYRWDGGPWMTILAAVLWLPWISTMVVLLVVDEIQARRRRRIVRRPPTA